MGFYLNKLSEIFLYIQLMSALLKLGSAVFGGSLTNLSLFKKQSFADADCKPIALHSVPNYNWNYNWDGRQNFGKDGQSKGTRNVLFIRHGQYQKDTQHKSLTQLGRHQAVTLGGFLNKFKEEFDLEEMDVKVYHSSMKRAFETCDIAMNQCDFPCDYDIICEPRIVEGCPIVPDPNYPSYNIPVEYIKEVRNNLNSFFKDTMHRSNKDEDSFEMYFCHSNVIKVLTLKLLQLPLNAWSIFKIKDCSITLFRIFSDGRVFCLTFGDAGFLEYTKCTDG